LSIFDEIYEKIKEVENERKHVEQKIKAEQQVI